MVTPRTRRQASIFRPINTRALALTIQVRRQRRGWSQGFLASELGVSQSAVARWEAGTRTPRGTQLLDLMALLEIDRDDIT